MFTVCCVPEGGSSGSCVQQKAHILPTVPPKASEDDRHQENQRLGCNKSGKKQAHKRNNSRRHNFDR
ncbi:hypothetical protein ZHAS_00005181 [Anopheles sinensis]|uniref:Uncharacterized protein n=1 Tax=Anopheles sinensis TaxID=74873 RepID=A0A084VIS1_ANOSI|nr:hypothetical protein ZHAS_00005181 [Anopheles sinensis]